MHYKSRKGNLYFHQLENKEGRQLKKAIEILIEL